VVGLLSLHGVTGELELRGELLGSGVDDDGATRVGLSLTGQLSRAEYGMRFNQALGGGNVLVGDKVKLALEISAVRQA
jgi:polyisoprenoid-binding protein YceI